MSNYIYYRNRDDEDSLTYTGTGRSQSYQEIKAIFADIFINDGHIFKEWNTKRDGTGNTIGYNIPLPAGTDQNVYAIWEKDNIYAVKASELISIADGVRNKLDDFGAKITFPSGFVNALDNIKTRVDAVTDYNHFTITIDPVTINAGTVIHAFDTILSIADRYEYYIPISSALFFENMIVSEGDATKFQSIDVGLVGSIFEPGRAQRVDLSAGSNISIITKTVITGVRFSVVDGSIYYSRISQS